MNVKKHCVHMREFFVQGRGKWVTAAVAHEIPALVSGAGQGTHPKEYCA